VKFPAEISEVPSIGLRSRDLGWCCREHGRHDSPERKNTEKLLTARVATIGWETQQALQRGQRALLDPFPRNVLKIEIPAAWTVDKAHEADCDRPGIEPELTGLASPGPQTGQGGEKVRYTAAVRTHAVSTPASRAYHLSQLSPVSLRQHTQYQYMTAIDSGAAGCRSCHLAAFAARIRSTV